MSPKAVHYTKERRLRSSIVDESVPGEKEKRIGTVVRTEDMFPLEPRHEALLSMVKDMMARMNEIDAGAREHWEQLQYALDIKNEMSHNIRMMIGDVTDDLTERELLHIQARYRRWARRAGRIIEEIKMVDHQELYAGQTPSKMVG